MEKIYSACVGAHAQNVNAVGVSRRPKKVTA